MDAEDSLALATRRTVCGLLNCDHESLYRELYTDSELMRNVGPPLTPAEAQRAFAATLRQQALGRRFNWVAVVSGTPIAVAGLVLDRVRGTTAEIGIIVKASHHNRGLATEVLGAVAQAGFDRLDLNTITTHSTQENKATFAFLRKLGFSHRAIERLPGLNRPGYFWELSRPRDAIHEANR